MDNYAAQPAVSEEPLPPWHQAAWQTLSLAQSRAKLPHALLISGPTGIGKTSLLNRWLPRLFCEQAAGRFSVPAPAASCDCQPCRWLAARQHPDVYHVRREDKKQAISIEQVRQLCAKLQLSSQQGGMRVAVIEQAELLSHAAANSLLKTLEEPPAKAVLILLCDRPSSLPATIRSRCVQLQLPVPASKVALSWLKSRQPSLDDRQTQVLLQLANGAPFQAQQLAQQLVNHDVLADADQWQQQLQQLLAGQLGLSALAQRWAEQSTELIWSWQCAQTQQQTLQALQAGRLQEAQRWQQYYRLLLQARRWFQAGLNQQASWETVLAGRINVSNV